MPGIIAQASELHSLALPFAMSLTVQQSSRKYQAIEREKMREIKDREKKLGKERSLFLSIQTSQRQRYFKHIQVVRHRYYRIQLGYNLREGISATCRIVGLSPIKFLLNASY